MRYAAIACAQLKKDSFPTARISCCDEYTYTQKKNHKKTMPYSLVRHQMKEYAIFIMNLTLAFR